MTSTIGPSVGWTFGGSRLKTAVLRSVGWL